MQKQYALILGASSGFGKAIAKSLAEDGVNIFGVHLDRATTMDEVNIFIKELKDKNVDVRFFNINAADDIKRKDVLDEIESTLKNDNAIMKVLLHSLAFGTLRHFIDEDLSKEINRKQLEMTLDVMANSLLYWTQDIVRRGLMKKGGKIYAMTSSGGKRVIDSYGAVSAAKACLESHVRQLAMELGKKGIAVNAVLAGVTETPALKKIPNNEKIIQNALQRNPSDRLTTPEDVGDVIKNIYKSDSNWMTGNVLQIDGGESIVEL
jgi:enoyl-[acyl-carrier-protein] reductase (NADH)